MRANDERYCHAIIENFANTILLHLRLAKEYFAQSIKHLIRLNRNQMLLVNS